MPRQKTTKHLNTEQQTRLIILIADIEETLKAELCATRFIATLLKTNRATCIEKSLSNELCMEGITVKSIGGSASILRIWQAAARRALRGETQ